MTHEYHTFFNSAFEGDGKSLYQNVDDRMMKVDSKTFWKDNYSRAFAGEQLRFELLVKKRRKKRWFEVNIQPVGNNEDKIDIISCLAIDITEEKKYLRELTKSEEKYRQIFNSFQDIYFKTDLDGNFTELSPSVHDILGYTAASMVGKNVNNFYIYTSKIKKLPRQLLQAKKLQNFEIGVVHVTGRIITCLCNLRLIYNRKKPVAVEGVAHDVSEIIYANKRIEQSKELEQNSLKIRERFLANMSHELKTPLNGIIGMIHLIEKDGLRSINEKNFEVLKNSSELLLNSLEDLLDISKIESGKMSVNLVNTSIKEVVKHIQSLYEYEALKKDIGIKFKMSESIPKYILTDKIKVIQIISNLISNAIKFSRIGGKIEIKITSKLLNSRLHQIHFMVTDNGIGIAKKDLNKIFENFYQIDNSNTKNYKGTGLGLSISQKLVHILGGDIGVESDPSWGSRFWFTINAESLEKEDNHRDTDNISIYKSCNLLVVDDNKVNLQIAQAILLNNGCNVDLAMGGLEGIDKCMKSKYDIILMDIQMSDIDGLAATKKIKLEGENTNTPVLAMTAYTLSGDKEKFLLEGMDDYISKPINPKVLITTINHWLQSQTNINNKLPAEEISKEEILNPQIISTLITYGGMEVVKESLEEFIRECQIQLKQMKEHFKIKNFEEILIILHTLKGNAGTLGAEKISISAVDMEQKINEGQTEAFDDFLTHLRLLLNELKTRIIFLQ